jgi:protein transport protein HofC
MYAVLGFALASWLGVILGLGLVGLLIGVAVAIAFGGAYLYAGRRSTQQDALLWALAITAERGMPLAPTFDVLAYQCRGEYRRKVLAAAYYLRQGLSLPQVLEREPGLFPADAVILTRVGQACGTLTTALRESAQSRARFRGPWMTLALRVVYLLWLLTVLETITGFTFAFILPKYQAIFADFGTPLPSSTNLMIAVADSLRRYGYLFAPIGILQLGLLMLAMVASVGVLPWNLPLVAHLFFRRHTAVLLRCLAYVIEGNKPMAEVLGNLARIYPAEPIRNRLLWVVRDIEAGEDWCAALAGRGLIRPSEEALLEAAKRTGNLAWALRQAAESSERRLTYRFQLFVQWFLPLCLVLAGALVFLIAFAYFTPLVVLIQKLSG